MAKTFLVWKFATWRMPNVTLTYLYLEHLANTIFSPHLEAFHFCCMSMSSACMVNWLRFKEIKSCADLQNYAATHDKKIR